MIFDDNFVSGKSYPIKFNELYLNVVQNHPTNHHIHGYDMTIGDVYHQNDNNIDSKNWMKSLGFDRVDQIMNACENALQKLLIVSKYNYINDYPKKGVVFQDLMPVLYDGNTFNSLINLIKQYYVKLIQQKNLTNVKIAGLESRGLMLAGAIAFALNVGFIPLRKKGKLPGEVYHVSYNTEYSTDTIEIQPNAIDLNDNIIIVDDLIATGGSLLAACKLIEKCGGNVVELLVLRKVDALYDKATNVLQNYNINVILD